MQLTKELIMLNKINDLKKYIYAKRVELKEWKTKDGIYKNPGEYDMYDKEWKSILVGDYWTCKDLTTRLFEREVTIPQDFDGKKVVLDLEFGGEAIVRIDGKIISAITSYLTHQKATRTRVLVAQKGVGGSVIKVSIEAGMNYMEFSKFRKNGDTSIDYRIRTAALCVVDTLVEDFYFDALVAYESLEVLKNPFDYVNHSNVKMPHQFSLFMEACGKDPYIFKKVSAALLNSLSQLDMDFDRERVVSTIPTAKAILKEELEKIDFDPHATVVFTGHAHIDTAWLWPIRETVRKCAKTFSNSLSLLEQYPNHVFANSQPQQYQYMKDYYPEIYEKIKEKVKEKRWELIGNTWVETDTNIPSGESLIRQILYGRKFFMDEFGKCSDIYWMPDVFGYSWAMPQIIKRSGMKYFYTSKLINNDINRFPHSLFMWQGIDGTRIPSYLQRVSYNGEINPRYVYDEYVRFDEKDIFDKTFITYGFGDGGGGATYEMLEFADRMKKFPGLPSVKIDTAESYFNAIDDFQDKLEVWNDEMYYEFHRGTYTSQADVKKNNRKCELLYRQAEIFSSICCNKFSTEYPMNDISNGWKTILLNQFHDIIPGSSINSVYKDCKIDYSNTIEMGRKIEEAALDTLVSKIQVKDDSILVFNSLGWKRSETVEVKVPDCSYNAICDENGNVVHCTVKEVEDGKLFTFVANDVPSIGYKTFTLKCDSNKANNKTIDINENVIENNFIKLTLDNGNIIGVFDKVQNRNVLSDGGYANKLVIFEDRPAGESAWNIDLEYQNKYWELFNTVSVKVIEASCVKGVLRVVKDFNKSQITQNITIYNNSPRVDFVTTVEWQETEKLLKAEFDVDVISPKATYEIAFGAIERPTHWNTSWDKAKFEVPAHKWADLSEGGYGVSILNDSKYGYDIKDSKMRITLLRAPVYPDPVADKGTHQFVYSLFIHDGDWRQADVVQEGYNLNVPLKTILKKKDCNCAVNMPFSHSFIQIDRKNVVIDTLKLSEANDGIVIRVYESNGIRGNVSIAVSLDAKEIYECNLVEEIEQQIDYVNNSFSFKIKPYEIKTFIIK